MTKKVIEKVCAKDLKEVRKGPKYTFGSKSAVTGEEYVDPNEADWQKYFQRQADKEKAS